MKTSYLRFSYKSTWDWQQPPLSNKWTLLQEVRLLPWTGPAYRAAPGRGSGMRCCVINPS